nr:nucleotidyltransferase family protein [Nakamurella flavida]
MAAGSGRRFGGPKALARDGADGEPWVLRALRSLAGCDEVLVVLGAAAVQVRAVLPAGVRSVVNPDHASGMGGSLRVGLAALGSEVQAALVQLVDLPDVTAAVVDRVLAQGGAGPAVLVRAAYRGTPGHPVLLGRDHWAGVVELATGDRGAGPYLARHPARLVECGDLAGGADVDRPG